MYALNLISSHNLSSCRYFLNVGDPRMHKAVAARMENPNLSLYDALLMGGFDYFANDDKSILDSKNVTLGQRKNQLSRRLRLAKKAIESPKARNGNSTSKTDTSNIKIDATCNIPSSTNINSTRIKTESKRMNYKSLPHSAPEMNQTTLDSINGGLSNTSSASIGNRQCKKARLDNYLRSTSFDRTCTMATAINQKLSSTRNGINANNTGYHHLNQPNSPFFNSQISNPTQPPYPSGASAMALSSLTSSAQKVGLTLEQLALALSANNTSLAKLVAEERSGESMAKQEQLALDIYKTEVKSLYTRCLIMAGVDSSLAESHSPTYTKFATRAWNWEGNRLRSLAGTAYANNIQNNTAYGTNDYSHIETRNTVNEPDKDCNATIENAVSSQNSTAHKHETPYDSHTTESEFNNIAGTKSRNDQFISTGIEHDSSKCDGRHMHRIGECGHRAIIHQPKDGSAPHVDFIVNDQVECYSGQDTMSLAGRSLDSAWPSKYMCNEVEETSCAKSCGKNILCKDNGWGHVEPLVPEPKIFKLSEIDTEDSEWTFDANDEIDGGVLGLFKLGRDGFT